MLNVVRESLIRASQDQISFDRSYVHVLRYFSSRNPIKIRLCTISRNYTRALTLCREREPTLSQRTLTVQDIILMQKQLEAAQHLNGLLGEAVAEIGEAVGRIDPASVNNQDAAAILNKVRKVISELEKKVEEFNRRLK
jgi:hypothetical protein